MNEGLALRDRHFEPRHPPHRRRSWREARRALGLRPPMQAHRGRIPRSTQSALQLRQASGSAA